MWKLWNSEPGSPPTLHTLLWPGWLLSYTHSFNFTQFHLGQLFFSILWIPPIEAKKQTLTICETYRLENKASLDWLSIEWSCTSIFTPKKPMKKIKLYIPVKNTIYSACGWKYSNDGTTGTPFWSIMQEKGVGMSPVEVTL